MKTSFLITLIISFSWGIGLEGLIIPENGYDLSTAGTGIAGGVSPSLNPALNISETSYFQFSYNQWLGDIKGSHTSYHWGRKIPQVISIQSWNAKDLELRNDIPIDVPEGTFSVNNISTAYTISHNFRSPFRFGMRIKANYSHLFIESISSISFDAGVIYRINSIITSGLVVRNLGYKYTDNLKSDLPMEIGIGTKFEIPYKISILVDAINMSEKGLDYRFGLQTDWQWINLSAGVSNNTNRQAKALGFSFNYRKWNFNYGVYFHENSILGTTLPQFLDIRRYL